MRADGDRWYRFGPDYQELLELSQSVGYDSVSECIRDMYFVSGHDTMAPAEFLKISTDRVRCILKKYGIKLKKGGSMRHRRKVNFHPDDEKYNFCYYNDLIAMASKYGYQSVIGAWKDLFYKHGTATAVAKIFNVNRVTVSSALKKEGVKLKHGGYRYERKFSWPDEDLIRRLGWHGGVVSETMMYNLFGTCYGTTMSLIDKGMPYIKKNGRRWYSPNECWGWMIRNGYAKK